MDALGLYIKEALRHREKISLPGIGTFKKERIPAFFDDLKQCFIPPSQSITLTDTAIESDQSLIQFVADRENISIEESHLKIEQTIQELENELQEKEVLILEGFGKLQKAEGRYEFIHFPPHAEGIFNNYEPVAEIDILPNEKKVNNPVPANINTDETLLPIEEAEALVSEEDTEEQSSSGKWLWFALAFVVCAGIAAVWYFNPNIINDFINKNQNTTSNQKVIEQKVPESATQPVDLSIQSQPSASTEETVQPPVSEGSGVAAETQGNFEIIIAAFNTMTEAEDYVSRTNAKGYHVYIMKNNNPGNLNKISYGSFQTAAEAEQALIKVREELTKEAWVFENKAKQ